MAEPVPGGGGRAGVRAASSVALPLLWLSFALIPAFKAWPQWSEAAGFFMKSLGEADPWTWAGFARALGGHAVAAAGLAAILVAALAAGGAPPRLLGLPAGGGILSRLVSGFGVASLLLQGLGLTGLWHPGLVRAVSAALIAAGIPVVLRLRPWRRWRIPAAPVRLPATAVILLVGASFVLARLPDTHDDPRTYHFAAPEAFLLLHKIHAEPLNVNWHMPLGAEMLFGAGWAAGDIEGAKLLNLAFLLALVLAAHRIASRLSPGSGWWAAALVATTGLVPGECWQGKNDILLAAAVASALWCATEAVAGGPARWWLGAAWFLGLAAGVKFTAGFHVGAFAVAAALASRRPPARAWIHSACLVVIPVFGWLASSWLFLGDPFHPFLSGVFPDLGWGPRYQKALSHVMVMLSPPEARWWPDWFFGPWRAWADPGLGSLALMVLFPLGLAAVRGPVSGLLGRFVLVAYLLWLPTERNARYLWPAVPALAAFGAAAAFAARGRAGRAGVLALLGAATAMALATAGSHMAEDGWQYATGRVGRAEFLARRFTTWEEARRWVNANVPASSRVLFTGEERRLWFRPRVRSYYTVHEPVFWKMTRDSFTVREMRKRVRQMGVSFQLHNFVSCEYRALTRHPGPPWSDRQVALYRGFTGAYLRPVLAPRRIDYANGGFHIFAFDSRPAARPWPVFFLPLTEGAFYPAYRLQLAEKDEEALAEARAAAARFRGVAEADLILAKFHSAVADDAGIYRIMKPVLATGFVGDNSFRHFASAAMNEGRWREGLAAYVKGWLLSREAAIMTGIAYGFYRRAQERMGNEDWKGAMRDLEAAVRLVPDQPVVLYAWARALARAGRRSEALAPARRALAAAPGDPDIRGLVRELAAGEP